MFGKYLRSHGRPLLLCIDATGSENSALRETARTMCDAARCGGQGTDHWQLTSPAVLLACMLPPPETPKTEEDGKDIADGAGMCGCMAIHWRRIKPHLTVLLSGSSWCTHQPNLVKSPDPWN